MVEPLTGLPNLGSFAGLYGETVRHQSLQYLKQGAYDRVGTDAHRFKDLGRWLIKGVNSISNFNKKAYVTPNYPD